jgi:hypothetical protein
VEKAHQYLQEQGMIVRLQVQLQQAMATFSLHTHAIASAIDNLHFFQLHLTTHMHTVTV